MEDHAIHLVENILLVIGISIVVVFVFQRLHLPAIAGFILTGALIGPYGLGWIEEAEAVKFLAEIGVVLLLFSLGVEFSVDQLIQLRHYVIRAGVLQIIITITVCATGALILGYSFSQMLILGMIISLSSTAVGIKLLKQRKEMDSTHGRFALGVLLFQDIMAPVFMAIIPFISQLEALRPSVLLQKLVLTVLGVGVVFFLAKLMMPFLLRWITTSENREIPVLGSIFVALLMGYFTQKLGLSPALGAFIAGVVISETPYSHQITANIVPFRDSFLAIFFISVGLLVNLNYFAQNWGSILGWSLGLMALKCFIVVLIAFLMRRPLRIGILSGVILANIGEFSFVLMNQSRNHLSEDLLNGLIAGTSLSIMFTPMLLAGTYKLIALTTKKTKMLSYYGRIRDKKDLKDHVIVVGFGLNGRNLSSLLKELGQPFVVVEMNGALVREAQKQGINVVYGDASFPEVLEAAGIKQARAVVLAVSDPVSTRYAVKTARELNSSVYIIARTRYVSEIERLYEAGATDVIPEEFETFIEIAGRIMRLLKLDNEKRLEIMSRCREQHYKMFKETQEGVYTN
ncbi:MAG: cation:proton antiporter [Pyrinomonadaceae bacterium]|nr:cation:proton antiporter [Pyrinomonadaceae bacterium]MCX7639667.1 cation:proton antiporter [Pyrinomonadaceae bacterium]MDW8303315.1 cation:proton antiporter [Acidobacteriota bacterium]